ncbi:hypothetical protein E1165_21445, partial [Micromonospora sp. KC723]
LAGDRDHITAELQGKRFRHDRHPSSEERILTGQESTEPGADPFRIRRAPMDGIVIHFRGRNPATKLVRTSTRQHMSEQAPP